MSEQKYRQRGYKDDDWDEDRQRRPAPKAPRDRTLRPGGRGLGKPTATVYDNVSSNINAGILLQRVFHEIKH